jgi:GT2 family glycosyltransferase
MGKRIKLLIAHIFFDPKFYLDLHEDVRLASIDPWKHYCSNGWQEKRLINRILFLLKQNFDFEPLQIKGWEKIIKFGWLRLRFDSSWYLENYPDIKAGKLNPWHHFVSNGKSEGRAFNKSSFRKKSSKIMAEHFSNYPVARYLTSRTKRSTKNISHTVVIIIPVYRGFAETQNCLNSVLNNLQIGQRLLVINDNSPEQRMTDYLQRLANEKKIEYHANSQNIGFVSSVNLGMRLAKNSDVILLNSDTEVHGAWVDRLGRHAYSGDKVGTVTPFSNNATICSWPSLEGSGMFGPLAEVDTAFEIANRGRSITIPTAVGFCMYIRRDCLSEIGYFDEKKFGKGYGEENDFCMKATRKGWLHLQAADVFVYHKGETSFGTDSIEKKHAGEIIRKRYPHYDRLVQRHVKKEEIHPYKFAATAEFAKKLYRERVLILNHGLGGGADKYLRQHIEKNSKSVFFAEIKPFMEGVCFSLPSLPSHPALCAAEDEIESKVCPILENFNFTNLFINHLLGFSDQAIELLKRFGQKKEFIAHDYFTICPRVFLAKPNQDVFCGLPDEDTCNLCLSEDILAKTKISEHRKKFGFVYAPDTSVYYPTQSVAKNIKKIYTNFAGFHLPHENIQINPGDVKNDFCEGEIFRIAILGALTPHKGRERVVRLLEELTIDDKVHIYLVGYMSPIYLQSDFKRIGEKLTFTETGPYKDDEVAKKHINNLNPHLFWFPVGIPETYSYTLSLALDAKKPIAGPNLPFFKERTSGRPFTFYLDYANFDPRREMLRIKNYCRMNKSLINKI